jgi:AraC family transcriptional regulator of adaptative response/methylated-DNA-[protein]-cysteine methyltransferase
MSASTDFQIVADSLSFLGTNFRQQPSLDELASRAGMSKYHYQRVFTRWAGVSPKRFLQFLTVEHAKKLLRDSEPILSTAFSLGLSGPARLHDLFLTTEGVTPGEFRRGGAELEVHFGVHDSPFGFALLASTERGICHLSFLPQEDPGAVQGNIMELRQEWPGARLVDAPERTAPVAKALFEPNTGKSPPSSLSIVLKGTNFQIKVWTALLRIPPGTVTTYGRLARALGQPTAARAVGSAVGRNPVSYLIPCHRVIRELGTISGYRWGPVRKRAMLGWEAARKAIDTLSSDR